MGIAGHCSQLCKTMIDAQQTQSNCSFLRWPCYSSFHQGLEATLVALTRIDLAQSFAYGLDLNCQLVFLRMLARMRALSSLTVLSLLELALVSSSNCLIVSSRSSNFCAVSMRQ